MWGLLVGIAIGGLQLFSVYMLGKMIIAGGTSVKLAGVLLFVLKMAAIIAILYLIYTVSLEHLIWTAGGILLGLVAASFYMLKRRRRNNTKSPLSPSRFKGASGDDDTK